MEEPIRWDIRDLGEEEGAYEEFEFGFILLIRQCIVIHVWRSLSGEPPWNFVFLLFYPNISAMREMRERDGVGTKGRIHDTDTETDTQRER
ncbi:hypothetical protein N5P37_010149 [Trichoderma harzianum]|nr:hypothetical protein N5P37_010149 [Trichoderma harzianum]